MSHHIESDANETRLDLARAYIDFGDPDGCRELLHQVIAEGTPEQRIQAQQILDGLAGQRTPAPAPLKIKASHSSGEPSGKAAATYMDDLFP